MNPNPPNPKPPPLSPSPYRTGTRSAVLMQLESGSYAAYIQLLAGSKKYKVFLKDAGKGKPAAVLRPLWLLCRG